MWFDLLLIAVQLNNPFLRNKYNREMFKMNCTNKYSISEEQQGNSLQNSMNTKIVYISEEKYAVLQYTWRINFQTNRENHQIKR